MTIKAPGQTTIFSWLLLFAMLLAAALALYAPILQIPFGGTDYKTFLMPLKERSVSAYEYITIWSPLAERSPRFTRPLLKLLLLVEHRLWGHNPLPYRLLNLLIHVGCGLAAAGVVLAATGRRKPAWLAGLILTVHPAAVPAVRWISARGDLTATFFSLLALGAVFRLCNSEGRQLSAWKLALPALLVLLALTGKELGLANFIALPLVWFLWPDGKRARRAGLALLSSLAGLLVLYIGWRLFSLGRMRGYGAMPGLGEWPDRIVVLFWQTSGADLITSEALRTIYIALLISVVVLLAGRSAMRWRRIGLLALLMAVYGFQSIIAGIQDSYYAYAPSAILAILLVTTLVDAWSSPRCRTAAILLLLPLIGLQAWTAARANMEMAVDKEVTGRLMAAIGEKERLMGDNEMFLLRLVGQERDKRIRHQSKIFNVYLRYLRGPDGPAIRRNPNNLPPNPRILRWDGVNMNIIPLSSDGAPQSDRKQ